MMRVCLRTVLHLVCVAVLLCGVVTGVDAQSFASLRRSTGKSSVYSAVEQSLANNKVASGVCQAIQTGDIEAPFEGKTPIYLVMDRIATHPKTECQAAEEMLSCFLARKGFDINQRYNTLLPPMAYLIRTNKAYLGGHFSTDYISGNVLRMLIEAGARVNTYDEEGSSLMTLAQETNNSYLQSYFVSQGINLRHKDKEGVDDVYKLIADGNLPILKRVLEDGTVKIDIHTLKNDPKDFAQYSEMYDYLAHHCANGASTYDDIVTFRDRFSDRRALVQQKYETLARSETAAASDFKAIQRVRGRYPDLTEITESKRLKIYREHVKRLESANKNAQAAAAAMNYYYSFGDDQECVDDFVKFYEGETQYDPDSRMTIAKETQKFHYVCHALTDGFERYYKKPNYSGMEPWWYGGDADVQKLNRAESILDPNNKYGFGDFYKQVPPLLERRRAEQREHEARQRSYFAEAMAEYEAWTRSVREKAMADMREQERERAVAADPNVSLSSIGITYETSKWTTNYELGDIVFQVKDYEKKHYMDVKYSDGTKGYIIKEPDVNEYLPSGGVNILSSNDRYATLSDAIAAEYFFKKYKSRRTKGLR